MNPITIAVPELKTALAGLSKVIPRRGTLPVLAHVRIERTGQGQIELAGTDLDSTAAVQLDTPDPGEAGAFLVPYSDLNNVVKGCGRGDALVLSPTESDRVSIQFPAGGQIIEHRCQTLPVEEFPSIPDLDGPATILDEPGRRAIREAFECASDDPTRFILNGACLDVSRPRAHYIVATDGTHLFSSNTFSFPLSESLVIPTRRFLAWKEFHEDGDWNLRTAPVKDAPARIGISSVHWRFTASVIEGNFPNWRQVVPDAGSFKTSLAFDPSVLDSLIQTIGRMPDHDPAHHALGIELVNGAVRLLCKSSVEEAWNRLEVSGVTAQGRDVTAFFNRHFLAKALRFGLTRLDLIDALSPLRFSHEGRQMIVMPTRPTPPPKQATSPVPPAAPETAAANETPPPKDSAEQPQENPMPENSHATNGATRSSTTADAEKPALETALSQIEAIKGSYREAIRGLNGLADLLKHAARDQKTAEKEISSVRQTLRQIQAVRI